MSIIGSVDGFFFVFMFCALTGRAYLLAKVLLLLIICQLSLVIVRSEDPSPRLSPSPFFDIKKNSALFENASLS